MGKFVPEVAAIGAAILLSAFILWALSGCATQFDPCTEPRSLISGDPLPMCFIDCTATVSATNSEGSNIAAGQSGQVSVQRNQSPATTSSTHKETSNTTTTN